MTGSFDFFTNFKNKNKNQLYIREENNLLAAQNQYDVLVTTFIQINFVNYH